MGRIYFTDAPFFFIQSFTINYFIVNLGYFFMFEGGKYINTQV